MKVLAYNTGQLKEIIEKAYPGMLEITGVGITGMLNVAARDFFVGKLPIEGYDLAILQSAQMDLNEYGELRNSKADAIEAHRDWFEGNGSRGLSR